MNSYFPLPAKSPPPPLSTLLLKQQHCCHVAMVSSIMSCDPEQPEPAANPTVTMTLTSATMRGGHGEASDVPSAPEEAPGFFKRHQAGGRLSTVKTFQRCLCFWMCLWRLLEQPLNLSLLFSRVFAVASDFSYLTLSVLGPHPSNAVNSILGIWKVKR